MNDSRRFAVAVVLLFAGLAPIFSAPAAAVEFNMGQTGVLGQVDSNNANLLVVQQATLAQTAWLLNLSFNVVNAAGDLRLGVYDDTGPGGGPGGLVAETPAFTPVAGWNTQSTGTPVQLAAGTYWLAYLPSSNSLSFATDFSSGSHKAASQAFGPMPGSFPATIANEGVTEWSLYATLDTVQPPPDTSPPTVSIDNPPVDAQVSAIVNITAVAADDTGITYVQFFLDGVLIGAQDNSEPYGLAWDTRTTSNGVHTLTAVAYDTVFKSGTSAPVTVNVTNTDYFQNEILATGIYLPTALKFLPDGRMLVSQLPGTILVLPPPYTEPDPEPFLDLGLDITGYSGLQQGIFEFILDPDFETNHYYYVFYTNDSPNKDRLSRFTVNETYDGTLPGSEVILYEDPDIANTEHHGGAVNFGNDGKLYFTTGEHFTASAAQDLTSPRGKIHRINKDGTVPTDNPFYDGAGPHWDSIWAYGLRNPYRAFYDPTDSRYYIGDVGGNNYSTAIEEVDLGAPGANYGWPDCESGTCGNPGFTAALYAYPHNGRDASVTGGFVYHGSHFPAEYAGSYFFADYAQNWIRRLTFNPDGSVANVYNFEPADGSLDGPYGDIVYLAEGPDGMLYYIDLGYSDVGGTFGVSKIRRIRYASANQQPTAIASADVTSGTAPLTVNFSSAGSFDPEGQPTTYTWDFGDGSTSASADPTHVYTAEGSYTVRLTVSDGNSDTLSPPLTIEVGNKPVANITAPVQDSLFLAEDVIAYSGDATDIEDGTLPAGAFTWDIDFLHAGHVHPGAHVTGVTSGTFTIPTTGHDFSGDTRYRVKLTVVDSDGLNDTREVIIYPDKVDITLDSLPHGLTVTLDGIPYVTPFIYDTLKHFQHTLDTSDQTVGNVVNSFAAWSDGGTLQHTITVPATPAAYTALFNGTVASLPGTLGETAILGATDSGNGNLLVTQQASLAQNASLLGISFYIRNAAGNLRLGIYDATGPGGGPGALLAQTSSFTPVTGWNTQTFGTPVQLPAGTYWLAYLPSSNSLSFAVDFNSGSYRSSALAFGPMPATFPDTIDYQGTSHWSLYATLDTAPPPLEPAGCIDYGGDFTLGSQVTVQLSLGGIDDCTGYDRIAAAGQLALDGASLLLTLDGGYVPAYGDRFNILDWGSLGGTFGSTDLGGALLPGPLVWDISDLYTTGEIAVDVQHYSDGDLAPWDAPDGLLNAADILIATQLNLKQRALGALQYAHGDMDGDGDVDIADLLLIDRLILSDAP